MDIDEEIRAEQAARRASTHTHTHTHTRTEKPFTGFGSYDTDLYDEGDKSGYAHEVMDMDEGSLGSSSHSNSRKVSATTLAERAKEDMRAATDADVASSRAHEDMLLDYRKRFGSGLQNTRIADREDDYHKRRYGRGLSPERAAADTTAAGRTYGEVMQETVLAREKAELQRKLQKLTQDGAVGDAAAAPSSASAVAHVGGGETPAVGSAAARKRRRWDTVEEGAAVHAGSDRAPAGAAAGVRDDAGSVRSAATLRQGWEPNGATDAGSVRSRWEATPLQPTSEDHDETASAITREAWEATPVASREAAWESAIAPAPAPAAARKRSRWDETPAALPAGAATPAFGGGATPAYGGGATPMMAGGATPTPSALMGAMTPSFVTAATPQQIARSRIEAELDERNRPLSDEELDAMFPKGYKILEPPAAYVPIRTPSRKATSTPTPLATPGFHMAETPAREAYGIPATPGEVAERTGVDLPYMKPEDMQYFGILLEDTSGRELTEEEEKTRLILTLLLKIKNGTPPQRKSAMRQITEKARSLGAGPLFNQLLPLLHSQSLEDQERHLLVKVMDRIMYRLDELVRPYVHNILVVIEPMLIDEDYYARVEGREIISNLAKAAGLATMIATMRPDLDHVDEYARNTTARAFAVVASALGIPALLPFLKAVCSSKKSWQARHTGVKIVQQIAILMGCAVLPHLTLLVEIAGPGLKDDQQQVRIMSALALAALAESAAPYGIEAFDSVLRPLWEGIRLHRGKALAAFLKAIGCVIPLMDAQYASHYTREVMTIVIREFATPDEEMKKIVLKVVRQCVSTEGVDAEYVRQQILPEFFRNFWQRRMALDKRNYRALVDTTVEVANRVGAGEIVRRIVDDLKDESEPYRRMVVETIDKVITNLGASDIEPRLEEQLMDGLLYAFQEQTLDESAQTILNGFGTVVNALGPRCRAYLPQIAATIKWRLNLKSPQVRMHAADLLGKVAGVMRLCGEDALLGHLGIVLYECLGEEFPEVLGSILGGLKAIVNVIGMTNMQPPIKDLLPRLTPILKNRHEKVQENCIDLVGRIADRGSEFASAREWMRICFELLEMLKAQKKAIRRACVNTFGYIAKAIGPQDVLHALLNNLKVQERQMRICTTVAIAIVAETCQPFTVLPALMNEYRVPDMNVQNGVLKALSFMFEYIGEMARDYVYAVAPLLQDALADRDLVHRQTACFALKHLALGLQGLGCEDALQHLLNYAWPNVLETSAHITLAVFEALEGLRVSLGPNCILQYVLQGLWHPARRVREVMWRIYNNLYIYSADQLTPFYPRIPNDATNSYEREYLQMVA